MYREHIKRVVEAFLGNSETLLEDIDREVRQYQSLNGEEITGLTDRDRQKFKELLEAKNGKD